jgi:hypothetical protein
MSDWNRRTNRGRQICMLSIVVCAGVIGSTSAQSNWAGPSEWFGCGTGRVVGNSYHEGPDFDIRVSFREQSMVGVNVVLTSETSSPGNSSKYLIVTGQTDRDGVAHFIAVPRGKYYAHVNEGLMATNLEIEIGPNAASADEVDIEWPGTPFVTRGVRGWLNSWQRLTPQNRSQELPLPNVQLQLLNLRTGKILLETRTAEDGYYEFPVLPAGLYVLRINQRPNQSTNAYDEAVEVTSNAAREYLPLLVVDNSCGNGRVEVAGSD